MADGKIPYLNKITGEIIFRRTKLGAYLYFRADGKKCGYKTTFQDIERYDRAIAVRQPQTENLQNLLQTTKNNAIIQTQR